MLYRPLYAATGVFAVLLGGLLLVAPELYLDVYLTSPDASRAFAARRLAPAVIGLGAVLFLMRSLGPGPVSVRFAVVTACVWFGVAATGVYDFSTGTAQGSILVAAAIETLLGILFLAAARGLRSA
ncbi:MAG: hypothetical protein AAFZ14_05270 [Pseudomonadota bacterium]